MNAPSRNIRLFGTDEPVEAPRLLRAGPLSAELEAGNLRYIRFDGIEMIRAISFIVRDRNWGTYNPRIANLQVREDADGFSVTYDAEAGDDTAKLRYAATITGRADGHLRFEATATAVTDFVTNRTGFVVLHPVADVAGAPATVEEVDGRRVETHFPDLIDPMQPMMNLRALTHSFAPGARVTCLMEGDTFEMEDQRNWTDASYKTYVRPLALPWPYTLAAGSETTQYVTLSVEGRPSAKAAGDDAVVVRLGSGAGVSPAIGAGLAPEDAAAALERVATLREARLAHVICHYDTRANHDAESLKACVEVAHALGADPWLEAVVTEVDGFAAEIARLGETVAALGSPFRVVLLSPASDLKSTLPGSVWPPAPPLADVYRAARQAFPGARLGGGMFSYFTELNRKRPPAELLDLVSFTTSALVHAGDDRSATESLEVLPYIARSVRAFAGSTPIAVGPSAIGMRQNPYGAAPMDNPRDIRQAMNRNDPRQRGLLGAAWNLGYAAHFAAAGAKAVTLGGLTGPFGIVHAPAGWPQAHFDDAGEGLYPVFHVLRGLAGLAGRELRAAESSSPRDVQALAVHGPAGDEVWIANLTGEPKTVRLEGGPASARAAVLDAESFAAATHDARLLDATAQAVEGGRLRLDAYAVARVVGG